MARMRQQVLFPPVFAECCASSMTMNQYTPMNHLLPHPLAVRAKGAAAPNQGGEFCAVAHFPQKPQKTLRELSRPPTRDHIDCAGAEFVEQFNRIFPLRPLRE